MTETAPEKPDDDPKAVVVRQNTVIDGIVVSWFLNPAAAKDGRGLISASKEGVMVHGDIYLHEIPQTWLEAAMETHAALSVRQDATQLVTHVRLGEHLYIAGPAEDDAAAL